MFLIVVTNNFGEIKSTVFKKYEPKSLFVIVASDLVERTSLLPATLAWTGGGCLVSAARRIVVSSERRSSGAPTGYLVTTGHVGSLSS